MNNITIIKTNPTESSVHMGQIYQYDGDFYIVARKNDDFTGCLISLSGGNIWSNEESASETILNNANFVLFKGTLQISTQ